MIAQSNFIVKDFLYSFLIKYPNRAILWLNQNLFLDSSLGARVSGASDLHDDILYSFGPWHLMKDELLF